MMRSGVFFATLLIATLGGSAAAFGAQPPPGAQISDSLEYVGRVPDSGMIVEGKFDNVGGRDVRDP